MVEVTAYDPARFNATEWGELHSLARTAFRAVLPHRSGQEIDELVGWDDPKGYIVSHLDPDVLVGKRYNKDQSFYRARVAVATDHNELVGFAYAADNVSGANEAIRTAKRLSVVKNYLWLREFAVHPGRQQQGVARELGRCLLQQGNTRQPVTAYIWPDEIEFLQPAMERKGFSATGEQYVQIYGRDSQPVRQVRMQAPSVEECLSRLG